MPLKYRFHITRTAVREQHPALFVFGDNIARKGMGGQAREMRGESNSVGLPTKRSPTAFLRDADLPAIVEVSARDRHRLTNWLAQGGTVIWPFYGIGTGRAELGIRAPLVAEFWDEFLLSLDPDSTHTIARSLT